MTVTAAHRFEVGGYKRWTNDGQLLDNPWINASSREFTVSSIGCAYRAELILGMNVPWTPLDLAAQRLRHALSPALWGFSAVASNERSPTDVH